MSWTVSYSYGTICDSKDFDDEDEAQSFYEMIEGRIQEFGNDPDNEYESKVEMVNNDDQQ
jgi:hypothetical protein